LSKFIFITGGVVSSIGKGITSASLGCLLKSSGYKVTIQKLDPYLNVDPGTMNPYQHGEVFVTEDGGETDLDLGHYERFIDENLSKDCNVTAGSIYWSIINKEREGKYLGGTVQVIPHVTNEIKERIWKLAEINSPDVIITEIGGTVGDIEGLPFLEAIRQFKKDVGRDNVFYIHVTLVPYLKAPSELKTKPTQHSVMKLREIGIQPDAIVCRSDWPLDFDIRKKIALFCDVEPAEVISAVDAESIYEVPLSLHEEGLAQIVLKHFGWHRRPNLSEWEALVNKIRNLRGQINVALVGKYVKLPDAYLSVVEALRHAGFYHGVEINLNWVDAEALTSQEVEEFLKKSDCVLVPGGFGVRGIEGKINAIRYARENEIPFLGICLGLQCAVIEFARNVAGLKEANSSEFDSSTPYPVIDLLPEQKKVSLYGGTMRLGAYPCQIEKDTKTWQAYAASLVYERHRHRYEVNNKYREILEKKGLVVSGTFPDGELVEIIELPDHPWFVATQFHPEFKSRPTNPHPLFRDFIGAAIKRRKGALLFENGA